MPTHNLRSPWQGALAGGVFALAVFYAAVVNAACGCWGCASGAFCALRLEGSPATALAGEGFAPLDDSVPVAEFQIQGRLSRTANDQLVGPRGNPVTVTWGVVDDGTRIKALGRDSPSDLIATLDSLYGAGGGSVEQAPWFRLFESAFDRWSELSGVTYVYEPNDGGAAIDGTTTPVGALGRYPDVRIGGHSVDGVEVPNTLAYNYFPNHSDMVLDTDNEAFYGNDLFDSRGLRNVVMHEAGHGLGLNHVVSSDSAQLMEPNISLAFDGPQIDDILAVQRNYGDALEKGAGNDSVDVATPVGLLSQGDRWAIGTDGHATRVTPDQSDFVSIDGLSDTDYYAFSSDVPATLSLQLAQVGATYQEGPDADNQSVFDASRLNPLGLTLYSDTPEGVAVVAEGAVPEEGLLSLAGTQLTAGAQYYVQVHGTVDNVQLYELEISLTRAVPEPQTLLLALSTVLLVRRRAA